MTINVSGNILSSTGFTSSGEIANTPNIVTDGLVLWYDAGNLASYNNSANYYDCGYGCQYYGSNPGCTNCNTQIKDMSGYGYDGTFYNTTIGYDNNGGFMSFNGSTTYVTNGVADSFYNSGSWSINVWVNMSSVNKGTDNSFVTHGVAGTNTSLHLIERGGYAYFGFYANDIGGTIPLSANNWYNIVFLFNYSSKLKEIYVNGVFDNSGGTVGYSGTGSNTNIGRYVNGSAYLSGKIPILIYYDKVLSSTEILQNFNAERSRFGI